MADVRFMIGGRSYEVHCADGEEDQLQHLASIIDAKARGVQGGSEVRQLLYAALMLADEANDAKTKAGESTPQLDSLRAAVALAESRDAEAQDQLRAAVLREQAALDQAAAASKREQDALEQLKAAKQAPASSSKPITASQKPAHERALIQIADRIEILANMMEKGA